MLSLHDIEVVYTRRGHEQYHCLPDDLYVAHARPHAQVRRLSVQRGTPPFTLREVPALAKQTLSAAGWTLDEVHSVVMHQANCVHGHDDLALVDPGEWLGVGRASLQPSPLGEVFSKSVQSCGASF